MTVGHDSGLASTVGVPEGTAVSWWTLGVAALLVVVGYLPVLTAPMNSDVAWLLYVAERWLDGAELYVDLLETNPPLVVWIYAPAAWLGRALDVSVYMAWLVWIGLLLASGLVATLRPLSRIEAGREPARRRALWLLLVAGVFLLAGRSLGQKDHLLLALTLPYLVTIVARAEGAEVRTGDARLVGVLAAVGVCMKPHFLLLPAALEGMRHVTDRGASSWWRTETRVLVAGIVAYPLIVLIATPEYFGMAREVGTLYTRHVQMALSGVATRPATLLLAIGWVAYALAEGPPGRRRLVLGFLVAGTALLFTAVLQLKGWSYHFLPAMALGAWAVALATTLGYGTALRDRWVRLATGIVALGLLASAVWAIVTVAKESSPDEVRLEAVASRLSTCGADDGLAVLSPRIDSSFPLVNRTGMRWGLRHPSQWMLAVAGPRSPAWHEMKRQTIADLVRQPPAYLLVDERASRVAPGPSDTSLLDEYRSDRRFREFLDGYRSAGDLEGYGIWIRDGAGRDGDPCLVGESR